MSLISLPYTFSPGSTIIASQTNSNNQTIFNDYNGSIVDANIASNAAIAYTKLSLTGNVKQSDILSTFNNNSGFGLVPTGGIIMWSGTIAAIPTGWYLCNGSNGTPDLRNMFVVCANADSGGVAKSTISGSAAQSGGSTTIATSNLPASGVAITSTGTANNSGSRVNLVATANSDIGSVSTQNLGSGGAYTQPYFALAYIMKS